MVAVIISYEGRGAWYWEGSFTDSCANVSGRLFTHHLEGLDLRCDSNIIADTGFGSCPHTVFASC